MARFKSLCDELDVTFTADKMGLMTVYCNALVEAYHMTRTFTGLTADADRAHATLPI